MASTLFLDGRAATCHYSQKDNNYFLRNHLTLIQMPNCQIKLTLTNK